MSHEDSSHVVAIFGGACAGSVAAEILATHGVQVVVFEQNPRPYGKIEDGLPRWHQKQRRMEYQKIDARLDRPGVTYVPLTRLGTDIAFDDVLTWGWSAVLLANGAWKDRPLEVPGAERYVGRGLLYQNPFVYWFNHVSEAAYDGPQYYVEEGAVCIGGGLASIDVMKIFQLETYGSALRARGHEVPMPELEHKGLSAVCRDLGIGDPATLGVRDSILVYRRRVEDMPLASPPDGATPAQIEKIGVVRKRILDKAREKYLFTVMPQRLPKSLIVEDEQVAGVVLRSTRLVDGRVEVVEGSETELRSPLVVSSIGSIPEPIPGIEMSGAFYRYANWDTGEYAAAPGVFGVGNVVTGKGNIVASLQHGKAVARHVVEHYLGLVDPAEREVVPVAAGAEAAGEADAKAVKSYLDARPPLPAADVGRLLERARARQRDVGYEGNYKAWLERVTPPDLE